MSVVDSYLDAIARTSEIKGNAQAQAARARGQILGNTLASLGQILPDIQQRQQQEKDRAALDAERQAQAADRVAESQKRGLETQVLQKQLNAPPDPMHAINLALTQHEALSRILSGTTADNYSARRQVALQLVPQAEADLPEAYPGDDYIKSLHDAGIPVKDQLEEARKQAEDAAKNAPKPKPDYTLGGQRFSGETNAPIAGQAPAPPKEAAPTEWSVLMQAAGGDPNKALALQRQQAAANRAPKDAPVAPDVSADIRTTSSGRKYVDLSLYTPSERQKMREAASAAGAVPVSKEQADALQEVSNARLNQQDILSQIEGMLPKDPQGRVVAAPNTALSRIFQTDEKKAAFKSWRTAAIQTLRATAGSKGLRINQAEIAQAIENDIPTLYDTVGVAKQKVNNITTMLENAEKSILVRDQQSTPDASGTIRVGPYTMTVAP